MSDVKDVFEEIEDAYKEPEEKVASISKCPGCGSNMVWNPNEKVLYCEHCGAKTEVDLTNYGEEIDFALMFKRNNSWGSETNVFRCSNCGAREILSKKVIATACPFCATTNIVEEKELSGIAPTAVLPFLFNKEQASEKFKVWARKKIFAPRAFKKSLSPEEVFGNYIPAFTFDSDTDSNFSGVLGKYENRTRKVNGKTITTRVTKYINIDGSYRMSFDDVLVLASDKVSQKYFNKIKPFKTNKSQKYSEDFLHGFSASHYSKDGEQCWQDARVQMEDRVKNAILGQYTYDFVKTFNSSTYCKNIKFKYILLPVYVGHCNWKKKLYNFFINGSNGKIAGKTPLSPLRIAFTSILSAGLGVGLYFLINYLGL